MATSLLKHMQISNIFYTCYLSGAFVGQYQIYENLSLLGCDTVLLGEQILLF
jgi:hypothetical protein